MEARFRKIAQKVADKVLAVLHNPKLKEQKKEKIKQRARISVREKLTEYQKQMKQEEQRNVNLPKIKKQKEEERG